MEGGRRGSWLNLPDRESVPPTSAESIGSDRTECKTRPCGCGNEATESSLGLSANRPTDRLGIQPSIRQRCGAKDSRPSYLPEPAYGGPSWLTDSPSLMNDFPPLASCCGQADEAPRFLTPHSSVL